MKLKRIGLKIAYKIAKIYWFVFRPTTIGTRCAIIHDNKVLLIKHTYSFQYQYFIPGGGVKKGEFVKNTIVRELKEEVNLVISPKKLKLIAILQSNREHKNDTVFMFIVDNLTHDQFNEIKINDNGEIAELKWFNLDDLPSSLSKLTEVTLNWYKKILQNNKFEVLLDYVEF